MAEKNATFAFSALVQKLAQESGYDLHKPGDNEVSLDWDSLVNQWGSIMNHNKSMRIPTKLITDSERC